MSLEFLNLLSSETLSFRYIPGQDKLYQSTNTESIFSFGDFRIQRNINNANILGNSLGLSFDRLQNLTSLNSPNFKAQDVLYLPDNELNPNLSKPNSYSYFGSYYNRLARNINDVIQNFPYAILAYDSLGGDSIYSINDYELSGITEISLISSAFTNQGNIIFTSGNSISSISASTLNLYDNFNQFEIQLSATTSGQTLNTTPSYPILKYNYSAITPSIYYLNFTVLGVFTANTTDAVYIRPSKKRYFQYKRGLSNIQYQLLEVGKWNVPNPDNDRFFDKIIQWPRSIDGFAPDSYGTNFDNFQNEILRYANLTDQIKTNWLIRAMIPENFLELDSDGHIYQKLIYTYADEFDNIKQYIDNLAFAHSVNYTETETIPNRFLNKLSNLLGWNQPINFTDSDFFEFLGKEDQYNKTLEDYNLDIWRRILTNINWLYKRKGTRDAITFIFKLLGAPACLVVFDEFVYKIQQSANIILSNPEEQGQNLDIFTTPVPIGKVNENGYINYDDTFLKFQEGGPGRGNGQAYINYWKPEFEPIKTVDNRKVYTGDPTYFGTENLINSKEVSLGLDPAAAIECDVFEWYKLGFFYSGNTAVNLDPDFKLSNVDLIAPPEISGYTISEWLNFVYNNSIDPKSRKIIYEPHHNYFYPNLRKIYLTYYYWNVTAPSLEISSRVNFRKLENFLRLVESKIFVYLEQIIPATTIFDGVATIYRNTVFNRQKFVYLPGINDGSEFQIEKPLDLYQQINGAVVTSKVNDILKGNINAYTVNGDILDEIKLQINSFKVDIEVDTPINLNINAFYINGNILSAFTKVILPTVPLLGNVIKFPLSGTPIGTPPPSPQPYTGFTSSSSTGTLGPIAYNPSGPINNVE